MQSTRHFCQILIKLGFSRQIFENTQMSNSMNIRPFAADLFHVERREDG